MSKVRDFINKDNKDLEEVRYIINDFLPVLWSVIVNKRIASVLWMEWVDDSIYYFLRSYTDLITDSYFSINFSEQLVKEMENKSSYAVYYKEKIGKNISDVNMICNKHDLKLILEYRFRYKIMDLINSVVSRDLDYFKENFSEFYHKYF